MTIYGLDPGETTGWAVLTCEPGQTPAIFEYGTISQAADWPRTLHRLSCWLTEHVFYKPEGWPTADVVVFEEWIPRMNLASRKEAQEARGVIRCRLQDWQESGQMRAWASYQPRQVRAALALAAGAKKGQIRKRIEELLGCSIGQKSVDATDAIAVALCHLAREGVWTPGLVQTAPGHVKAARAMPAEHLDLTTAEGKRKLDQMVRSGQARVGRR